jgi:excisionase family DNA binding protein
MLTVKKAADKFKVTPACILNWIRRKKIPASRVGNQWVLPDKVRRPPKGKPGPRKAGVPR